MRLVKEYQLCPKLCFLQKVAGGCTGLADAECPGACKGEEPSVEYNRRVEFAVAYIRSSLPSYLLLDEGRLPGEQGVILMEAGDLKGMGYIPLGADLADPELLKEHIEPYPSNDYLKNIVQSYALKHPDKVIALI